MRLVFILCLLSVSPVSANPGVALSHGEELTYRVAWGIFFHAGEVRVTARSETDDNQPCLLVTTTTSTRGFLRVLFPFDARSESVFSSRTGRMLVHTERSASGKKPTDTMLTFDYDRGTADFRDLVQPEKNQIVPLPAGNPMDLITTLIQARAWNMKPGDSRDVLVMFEEEPYELTLHAERYEEVSTSLGTFNTLLVVPRMEKTTPKGMFKRGSSVQVWIAQDDQHLPVKLEVEFKFGAGVATLTKYQPPSATNANPGS